jgi:hypothetical protein
MKRVVVLLPLQDMVLKKVSDELVSYLQNPTIVGFLFLVA